MTSSRLAEESTATMSIRGVITSATVVSASEKTPSSMSRSAGPAFRAGWWESGCALWRRPSPRGGGRAGAARGWRPRRGGRDGSARAPRPRRVSAADRRRSRPARSPEPAGSAPPSASAPTRPPPRPAAAPASTRSARWATCRWRESEPPGTSCAAVAAERAGKVGVRLRGQREPRGPEGERGGHQRREEELQKRDHASAPTYRSWRRHIAERVRAGTLGMGAAERVQRAVHHQADQLLTQRHAARLRLAGGDPGADVHVAHRARRRRRSWRRRARRWARRGPCARRSAAASRRGRGR